MQGIENELEELRLMEEENKRFEKFKKWELRLNDFLVLRRFEKDE